MHAVRPRAETYMINIATERFGGGAILLSLVQTCGLRFLLAGDVGPLISKGASKVIGRFVLRPPSRGRGGGVREERTAADGPGDGS
jgi:hypothetical protein